MSVSIESPHSSLIFSSFNLDSLSPPPTPAAKRARQFIPHGKNVETPMFFPKSQSLLGGDWDRHNSQQGASDTTGEKSREVANQLLSRPMPTLRLQRRSLVNHPKRENSLLLEKKDLNRIPPLPFSFDKIPTVPSLSSSKSSELSSSSNSNSAVVSSRPPRQQSSPEISTGPKLDPMKKAVPQLSQRKSAPAAVIVSKTTIVAANGQQQQVKLPSFQRGGMHSRTVNRRNSFVARSA